MDRLSADGASDRASRGARGARRALVRIGSISRLAAAAIAAGALAASPAAAAEPWASEDGRSVLELRSFYKSSVMGLRMQPGLVDASEALDVLLEAARAELPPEKAAALPAATALPAFGGVSAQTARIWGRLVLRDRLELQAGWQVGMLVASDRALLGGAALGAALPAATAPGRSSRRLVDLDPTLAERDRFLLQQNLDLLAVKVRTAVADVTVGRQVLSWGSGRLWNPTDLLSPFGPTDVDREVRHGVDAVRVSVPLAATAQLEVLWLPQRAARDQGGVARAQVNVLGFDLAPSVAKYGRDTVVGFDAAGDMGPLGVHAEAAWTRALDAAGGSRDDFVRAVAGADWHPAEALVLTAEYYFNGWGASRPSGYLDVLRSPRETSGEVFGAGRHYLGLVAAWRASELVNLQAIAIANLADPSVLCVPALEYWAEQSVLVRLYGSIPVGRRPDPAGVRALTVDDVTAETDAWRRATRSLGLGSEYGAAPWSAFAQVEIYFL